MISLNFLKLIYFLRSWAGKGWIRAIPRSFGASNSCHCHGRRPHFGTCLTSLWLRKPLFSQRGNFSRLASTRKHRQQVHASEMRDVRKAHKSKPKRSDTSLKSLLYAGRNLHGEHADETQVLIGFRVRLHWRKAENVCQQNGIYWDHMVWNKVFDLCFLCFRYVQWTVWLA
jgi:hypothetical protein